MWIKPHDGKLLNLDHVECLDVVEDGIKAGYFRVVATVRGATASPYDLTGNVPKDKAMETLHLIADRLDIIDRH